MSKASKNLEIKKFRNLFMYRMSQNVIFQKIVFDKNNLLIFYLGFFN